jgi:uncharacterized phosphosugar-binding protein
MAGMADVYLQDLARRIAALAGQIEQIHAAGEAIASAIASDRLIYVFGTGHSHMMAEEAHYRAGSLAACVPVLAPPIMLHEGAVESSRTERRDGVAAALLNRYPIGQGDVMFVVSNSGVNAAPLEAARHAKAKGSTVVAITSDRYSSMAAQGRDRLADLADIVLDNGAPSGDASLSLGLEGPRLGPVSTSTGAALLNAALVEAASILAARGLPVPLYVSSNMPGAAANNDALVARYRPRNPHL